MEPVSEADVRDLLPRTWHAFFARFGRLTEVQRRAVSPLHAGRSALLSAPTASGKTEAVVAPLAERLLRQRPEGLGIVVVSPTRALCTDLRRRLERPLSTVGLRLDLKTSDDPTLDEERPPHVLITTPESLDSILCRRARLLIGARALVLDEVHLVDRGPRGDQLAALVERCRRVASDPLQVVALSATLQQPERLLRRYLPAEAMNIGVDAGSRPIEAALASAPTLGDVCRTIATRAASPEHAKLLVFANSRSQVEALGALLAMEPSLSGRVHVHHGSLAKGERQRVEQAVHRAPDAICVATMTLELGIDIGDVDEVVLVAPPPNVASLLQRVGRGRRRDATTRALALYDGDFERTRLEHLLDCAANGRLFDDPIPSRPTAIAQQALSLVFQTPRRQLGPGSLHERLAQDARELWSEEDCLQILGGLEAAGWLRRLSSARFTPEPKAERAYRYGRMHSLLQDAPELEVVDETTGRTLGRARVTKADREKLDAGGALPFSLGGRRREGTRVREDRLFVRSEEGKEDARFVAREAPRYSYGLARDLAAFCGHPEGVLPVLPAPDGAATLAHFFGSVWSQLLLARFKALGHAPSKAGARPFHLPLARPVEGRVLGSEDDLRTWTRSWLQAAGRKGIGRLIRRIEPGAFLDCVPDPIVQRWVSASVDPDRFARQASRFELRIIDE